MKKNFPLHVAFNFPTRLVKILMGAICLMVLSISCHNDQKLPGLISDNSSSVISIMKLCGATTKNMNGNFLFQLYDINNDTLFYDTAMGMERDIPGYFCQKNGLWIKNGIVKIAARELITSEREIPGAYPNSFRQGLFGTGLNINLRSPDSLKHIQDTMYSPLRIHITNVPIRSVKSIKRDSSFEVTWNADPKNTKV